MYTSVFNFVILDWILVHIFTFFFTGHHPPLVQGQSLGPSPGQGHLSVLGGGGPDLSLLDPVFLEIIEPAPHLDSAITPAMIMTGASTGTLGMMWRVKGGIQVDQMTDILQFLGETGVGA